VYPKLWYVAPFLKYTLRQASKLTAITDDCKQHALNAGARENNIIIINNGADLERFSPKNRQKQKRYSIFSCRQLIPRKGMRVLIQAMPAILKKFPKATLRVAGDGVERPELEKMITKLGIGKHVKLLGWVPNNKLPMHYNQSEVVVMPSLEEGFGIPAAEAMGCEKPVVATDAGGLPEVVSDGKTGLIVPKGNSQAIAGAIIKLFKDPAQGRRMGTAGKKRAQKFFSWDKSTQEFETLFKKIIEKRRT